jgi:hypothetical protein
LGEVNSKGKDVRRIRVVFVFGGVIFLIFGVKEPGGEARMWR